MSTEEELFATDNAATEQEPPSFFDQLVGEKRKFKDAEALAKGKLDSDDYIKQLEARLREKETEFEEMNQKLVNLSEQVTNADGALRKSATTQTGAQPNPAESVKAEQPDIRNLVEQVLQDKASAETAAKNLETFKNSMLERFGSPEEAKVQLVQLATNIGYSVEELIETVKNKGSRFVELMLPPSQKPVSRTMTGTTLSTGFKTAPPPTDPAERGRLARAKFAETYGEPFNNTNPHHLAKWRDIKAQLGFK